MALIFYHNPRCGKSRDALKLLRDGGHEPKVVLYLETPPTAAEIKDVLGKLGLSARALTRTGEALYKELRLDDPNLTEAKLIAAMAAHPILIERPILVSGKRAIIGRPPERVLDIV